MSLYGYGRKTTPELDKWAADALIFEDAFTPASWTLPAGTSLFTSLSPYAHGVMGRNRDAVLPIKKMTLTEFLKMSGYKTAAFTGGLDYMKSLGHMRGFDTIPDNPPFTKLAVTIPQAEEWLSKNSGGKFSLFVHGYDAHPPFAPPSPFKGVYSSTEGRHVTVDQRFTYRGYMETGDKDITVYYHIPRSHAFAANLLQGKEPSADGSLPQRAKSVVTEKKTVLTRDDMDYLRDLYDEDILDVDQRVTRFLGSLDKKLLDKTIVMVLSEHGEMFARHGRFGRAGAIRGTLYEEVAHVPLMMKLPGVPGRRVHGLVQLVDIMPTVMEMLGVKSTPVRQGKSLMPLINSGKPVNNYVYAGTEYNAYMPESYIPYGLASFNEFIRDEKWKLIHEVTAQDPKSGKPAGGALETYELYDISVDTGETNNVVARYPDVLKDLSGRLKRWADTSRKFRKNTPSVHELPKAVLEKAKEHGYW